MVQLNYGTTNTSSNDPIEDVAQVAKEFGLWLHVDAAYAGVSWILPRFQARTKALEAAADSFNFNGSKWFLCGFDSAFLWVRSRRALQYAFAAGGDYLAPDRKECLAAPEFKDWYARQEWVSVGAIPPHAFAHTGKRTCTCSPPPPRSPLPRACVLPQTPGLPHLHAGHFLWAVDSALSAFGWS